MFHNVFSLDNKPIIITFLAMEKVILLCTCKTSGTRNGSPCGKNFLNKIPVFIQNVINQ